MGFRPEIVRLRRQFLLANPTKVGFYFCRNTLVPHRPTVLAMIATGDVAILATPDQLRTTEGKIDRFRRRNLVATLGQCFNR